MPSKFCSNAARSRSPTDVDGEDPVPPSEEIKKLKEKLGSVSEQASMAEQHKRAAAGTRNSVTRPFWKSLVKVSSR